MSIPVWWEFILLGLASFRVWRLLARDEVLAEIRDRLVRADNADAYRQTLDEYIRCPWCLGAWVASAWWAAWQIWSHGTMVAAGWWAIMAVVPLVSRLDP